MNNKHYAIIIAAVALGSVGCDDTERRESAVIEQATSPKPALTTTAKPALPEPTPQTNVVPEETKEIDPPVFEPALGDIEGMTIRRFVTASQIDDREPLDAGSHFTSSNERIYAFVEVSSESSTEQKLWVHFIGPQDQVSGGVELEIPASVPRWRTWAYTRHAKEPGSWRVELRNEDGLLIGSLPFEIEVVP